MAKVIVKPNESIEQALRRFNREIQKEGLMLELEQRRFHEKPSIQRRREEKERKQRIKQRRHYQ